jgi:hypothetical protein
MSVVPDDESAGAAKLRRRPRTTPCLPVVQFRSENPRLRVLFSAKEVAQAAQADPEDEFYDVRGIVVTLGQRGNEPSLRPVARGPGNPDQLKRRLLAELRRAAELETPDGHPTAEANAVLEWLNAAPDFQYMVHGLTLAPVEYDDHDGRFDAAAVSGRPCDSHCSWAKRFANPDACC